MASNIGITRYLICSFLLIIVLFFTRWAALASKTLYNDLNGRKLLPLVQPVKSDPHHPGSSRSHP
ncbi:hypothetical protein Patl1_16545 [Pistacia atlantica]|uniref:Uncharacterized protein n=1 Tax=Pistacia atlantica TaxID=434234 RepID=A0ACC1B6F1_9ROSI|nr:hypothetical protein Patl1_16545 [Pistacia atlantica]